MLLNRALILAVFVAANPALGAPPDSNQTSLQTSGSHTGADAGQTAPDPASLTPRQAYPKAAFVANPAGESQLAIKFRDDVRARAQADKRIVLNTAIDSKQLDSLNAIISRYNLKFVPAIPMAESRLNALTNKAAVMSGKAQPDLAGMMFIEANESVLQDAANALQKLDCVELVYFKVPWRAIGPPQIGACCNAGICTEGVTIIDCLAGGGTFLGPGELCTPGVCDVAACCLPDGNCQEVIEAQCDADGGTFQPGQVCLVIVCPQPEDPGACCVFLPSLGWQCQTETPTSCAKLDGVFTGGDCEGES